MTAILQILLITLLSITASPAIASDKPEWAIRKPADDDQFKFYVGRSSQSASEATAFNEATMDAIYQAIRDNYGFFSQIALESYETEDRATLVQRVKEASQNIRFQDFEQADSFTEATNGNRWNAWVLFRYSKQAIAKERKRLQAVKASNETNPIQFSTVGSPSGTEQGTFDVISDPVGASVHIDGVPWGQTPLRIIGKLTPGRHTIQLDHPEYESVQGDITISPNGRQTFKRVLVKASGSVRVATDPPNASVFVDGIYVGASPTDFMPLPTGTHTIRATHAETNTYTQEFQVGRDDQRTLTLQLPKKLGRVSIAIEPKGAEVILNGNKVTLGADPLSLDAGTYKLVAKKDGYIDHEETFELHGGQVLALKPIKLVPYSVALKLAKYTVDNPLNLSLGYGLFLPKVTDSRIGIGSPFGANVAIEKQFFARLGVKLSYRPFDNPLQKEVPEHPERPDDKSTKDKKAGQIKGQIIEVGVPIFFNVMPRVAYTRNSSYVMPLYSLADGSYKVSDPALVPALIPKGTFRTSGFGAELGYYWQHGAMSWRLQSAFTKFNDSQASEKLNLKQLWTLGLELGWTVGGVAPDTMVKMEQDLQRAK